MLSFLTRRLKAPIHSFETFGTVDGPGIRFVIFFSGCPLRCTYCHNIDVVLDTKRKEYTVNQVFEKIMKGKEYIISSQGGVTASGGDPALHTDFVAALFKKLKKEGIHTAFDTSLCTTKKNIDKLLPVTDLFLISIKQLDDEAHKKLTGVSNKIILENIRYVSSKTNHIWFRYLLLPGYTDRKKDLQALLRFIQPLQCELLELLPYHTLGIHKWKELNLPYTLENIASPKKKNVLQIKEFFEKEGIKVKCVI